MAYKSYSRRKAPSAYSRGFRAGMRKARSMNKKKKYYRYKRY